MRVELSRLVGRPLAEIRRFYATIPANEYELELNNDFKGEVTLFKRPHPEAALALSYLPKHIASVKFSGFYAVTEETVSERVQYDVQLDYPYSNLHIGLNLPNYVACLPASVTSVSFAFQSPSIPLGRFGYSNTALIEAISLLGSHISGVDFSLMEFRGSFLDLKTLCNAIPTNVTSFKVGINANILMNFLSWLPRTIRHLDVSGSAWQPSQDANFLRVLTSRHQQLTSLNLSETNLGARNSVQLTSLLSQLPAGLKTLNLKGNNLLARIDSIYLGAAFSNLPLGIEDIDLSDNGLLLMDAEDFAWAIHGLRHITRLRLCERNATTLRLEHLTQRFQAIPAHIHTLDFSDCNLFGLSVDEFCLLLQAISKTVTTLNLSSNVLTVRYHEDWTQLLASVPKHINTVLLEKNNFGCLDEEGLTEIFKRCPAHIKRLGLSHNGFSTLMITQLQQRLSGLPDVILDFSDDNPLEVSTRALFTDYRGLFKTHFVAKKQEQFAALLPLMQVIRAQQGLSLAMTQTILSFVVGGLSETMVQRLDKRIIAQTRPEMVTSEVLDLTIITINKRLEIAAQTQATVLDLSRCGLNRIENLDLFRQLFQIIPRRVKEINLIGNGFSQTKKTLAVFIEIIGDIPKRMTHLNLSHNGFESFNGEQLQALFVNLPPTVLTIALDDGKPLSPATHMGAHYWPSAYQTLLIPTVNLLQQARALLDDYTKGDSKFWRLFFLHWARHHTEDIVRLVMRIDCGVIIDVQDLLGELALIEPVNQVGSLSRRISFLNSKSLQATAEILQLTDSLPELTLDADDEVEMTALSYS